MELDVGAESDCSVEGRLERLDCCTGVSIAGEVPTTTALEIVVVDVAKRKA